MPREKSRSRPELKIRKRARLLLPMRPSQERSPIVKINIEHGETFSAVKKADRCVEMHIQVCDQKRSTGSHALALELEL